MSQEDREAQHAWALKMLALEEERGPIVPGGAVGGAVARARAAQSGAPNSVAIRARVRVRFLARAVAASGKRVA